MKYIKHKNSKYINMRIDEDILIKFRNKCYREEKTMTDILTNMINRYNNKMEKSE